MAQKNSRIRPASHTKLTTKPIILLTRRKDQSIENKWISERIIVWREVSEYPNLPVCCSVCLLQEASADKHSARSQSQYMCVVSQCLSTWEMLLEVSIYVSKI